MNTREILELELVGASQRVRLAQQELEEFLREHAGENASPELRQSLDREESLLRTELDAALRRHNESLAQVEELQVSELPRKGASEP
jgi:hypothetical protein